MRKIERDKEKESRKGRYREKKPKRDEKRETGRGKEIGGRE